MLSLLEVEGSREAARMLGKPKARLRCEGLPYQFGRALLDKLLKEAESAAAGVN
jgi:hypothetical protein